MKYVFGKPCRGYAGVKRGMDINKMRMYNNIKTVKEFEDYAECAYQRTHRLRELYDKLSDVDESDSKTKQKAFRLFLEMVGRMQKIITMYNRIKTYQFSKGLENAERGGI